MNKIIYSLVLLLLSGCSNETRIELGTEIFPSRELRQFVQAKTVELGCEVPDIISASKKYVKVDHASLLSTFNTFWRSQPSPAAESYDCDAFADAFVVFVRQNVNHEVKAKVAVGTISVIQDVEWANIKAGGMHRLNVFVSEKGIFVLEPQNMTFCKLDDYPNLKGIFRIVF